MNYVAKKIRPRCYLIATYWLALLSSNLDPETLHWILVKGFHLSYHDKETLLVLTTDPYYGNSKNIP